MTLHLKDKTLEERLILFLYSVISPQYLAAVIHTAYQACSFLYIACLIVDCYIYKRKKGVEYFKGI
jgi:hypothetical protein